MRVLVMITSYSSGTLLSRQILKWKVWNPQPHKSKYEILKVIE
jgi:hypothetical protein